LVEKGVGPESQVGLCVERSLEMVVGVLAILKAGGAYLPLDACCPRERPGFTLVDGQVTVLAQRHLAAALPVEPERVVLLEEGLEGYSGENLARRAGPEDLAYVIYTSGSNGRPKGVAVEHRGLSNLAQALTCAFGVDETDRVLQLASSSVDASVSEMVMALTQGAALHLVRHGALLSAGELAGVIERQGITAGTFPPALLSSLPLERLSSVRTMVVAGDACPRELAARWAPGRRLFNAYGSTETTVCASIYRCDGKEKGSYIGRPIANTRLYVLDGELNPVPVGVAGELYIGGAGLARGYLGRPELTAERFIPDPFGGEAGGRLYRSGDRVRYREDGNIEFLGRLDQRVKVRGFRIELAAVETALREHPAVREAAAMVREDQPGDERLVAYYAASGEVGAGELRGFLRQRLPEYMVPSAFVLLGCLPITANGKVDRKALPAPEGGRGGPEYVAPRTPSEEVLAGIWEQVLGVERVGVHDNFFDLGGHSLSAIQVVSRARQALQVGLPLRALLEQPTIEALAARLPVISSAERRSPVVTIQPLGHKAPLFLVHAIGGTVLCYHGLSKHLGQERPIYGLQGIGLEDGLEPIADLPLMAGTYVQAIREVQPEGPYLLAGWSAGGNVAFEMARQLTVEGQRVSFLGLLDSTALLYDSTPSLDEEAVLAELFPGEVPAVRQALQGLPLDQRMEQVVRVACQRNRLPQGFTADQALRVYSTQRAIDQAIRRHVPDRYTGDVTLIRSSSRMNAAPHMGDHYGWDRLVEGSVCTMDAAGDHFTMIAEPHCEALAKLIGKCIARF
jgi:amino acid adenylation domain-containing protein